MPLPLCLLPVTERGEDLLSLLLGIEYGQSGITSLLAPCGKVVRVICLYASSQFVLAGIVCMGEVISWSISLRPLTVHDLPKSVQFSDNLDENHIFFSDKLNPRFAVLSHQGNAT